LHPEEDLIVSILLLGMFVHIFAEETSFPRIETVFTSLSHFPFCIFIVNLRHKMLAEKRIRIDIIRGHNEAIQERFWVDSH